MFPATFVFVHSHTWFHFIKSAQALSPAISPVPVQTSSLSIVQSKQPDHSIFHSLNLCLLSIPLHCLRLQRHLWLHLRSSLLDVGNLDSDFLVLLNKLLHCLNCFCGSSGPTSPYMLHVSNVIEAIFTVQYVTKTCKKTFTFQPNSAHNLQNPHGFYRFFSDSKQILGFTVHIHVQCTFAV